MFGLNDTQKSEVARILNESLPKELHISWSQIKKDNWSTLRADSPSFQEQFRNWIDNKSKTLNEKKFLIDNPNNLPNSIVIYSCQPTIEYNPIGLIDIGKIYKFSGASTGDRFAGGLIGYALESAIDETYTKGNQHECKSELIKKCNSIYKDAITIFNFDVDFREMGSSGNVFTYMRGTACTYKDKKNLERFNKIKLDNFTKEYDLLASEIKIHENNYSKFPKSWDEVKKLIP
jgi:hypothetical protein